MIPSPESSGLEDLQKFNSLFPALLHPVISIFDVGL